MLALVDGFPAGMQIDADAISADLALRQGGYGRGQRQKLETDQAELLTGVWQNTSLGSPITLQVINRDYKLERLKELPRPRPGHGDLSGSLKYLSSIRGILERASARETSVRVAAGSLAKQLLSQFGISILGYITQLGPLELPLAGAPVDSSNIESRRSQRNASPVYCLNSKLDQAAVELVDETKAAGDTLGGIIEVVATGLPFGLGTHAQWDLKLDGKIAQAVMAVQAMKGVEIGMGFEAARRPGSQVHDAIHYSAADSDASDLGYQRPTNNAGGLEAGMTNGQPLIVKAAMKPISTLQKPLASIDMKTKEESKASYERSDVCALPAAGIIIECVVAFEIAAALVDKFGGDSVKEMKARWELFQKMAGEH